MLKLLSLDHYLLHFYTKNIYFQGRNITFITIVKNGDNLSLKIMLRYLGAVAIKLMRYMISTVKSAFEIE